MIKVEIDDAEIKAAFVRLNQAGTDLRPLMQQAGEFLIETTKQRFETSTAPDGTPWAPNAEITYLNLLDRYKSSYSKKTGQISAAGSRRVVGKKPLIGESRALSTTINYRAGSDFLEIGSPMIYAGVHQFGAKQGAFGRSRRNGPIPWGDIPARPFLGLSDLDRTTLLELAAQHLQEAAEG